MLKEAESVVTNTFHSKGQSLDLHENLALSMCVSKEEHSFLVESKGLDLVYLVS